MVEITREKIMEVLEDNCVEAWSLIGPEDSTKVAYGIIADQILDEDWYKGKYWKLEERKRYGRKNDDLRLKN